LVGATLVFDVSGIILSNALQGVGDTRRVLLASLVMQWGLMLPAAYVIGPVLGHGIFAIWAAVGSWRAIQAFVYASLWRGRGWTAIHV
jgi:Na+-driven multidrug efflux pump